MMYIRFKIKCRLCVCLQDTNDIMGYGTTGSPSSLVSCRELIVDRSENKDNNNNSIGNN